MNLLQIIAGGIIAAVAVLILRELKGTSSSALVGLITFCIMTGIGLLRYSGAVEAISELSARSEGLSDAVSLLLRALGISFTAQIGSDICRDMGAQSIASAIEMIGRAELLLICLPQFISFVGSITEMIG